MEYITDFFIALIELSNAMAPYILFGLLFAGILQAFVPDTRVTKPLGTANLCSVIKATQLRLHLPVCSLGLIILATCTTYRGAWKG